MSDIIVNSKQTLDLYKLQVDKWFEQDKYLTFKKPRIGRDRSLDQNALLHVWCGEVCAHFMNVNVKSVTNDDKDAVKRTLKRQFLAQHPQEGEWVVRTLKCPITGNEKKDFTSSRKWKTGEMFMFLEWMQFWAMQIEIGGFNAPLVLESRGEFEKRQRESAG